MYNYLPCVDFYMFTNSSGYDSRCCYCLWSDNNLLQAVYDNHKTVLHPLWQSEHFYVEVEGEDKKVFSVCRVFWSIAAYPLGMIGYLIDTTLKMVMLIGNFSAFVIALLSCNSSWMRTRGILLLDNASAVGIGVIGILAPPLAYRIERLAENRMRQWILSTPPDKYIYFSTPRKPRSSPRRNGTLSGQIRPSSSHVSRRLFS